MLIDTNILIYATFQAAAEHDQARLWLQAQLQTGSVVLSWPVIYALVRLITSPRIFGASALSVAAGWNVAQGYLDQSGVRMVTAGPLHQSIALDLANTPGLRSDDVPDIEIAALAIEHGLVLASHDRGFRRFSGVRVVDPLNNEPRL